MRYELSDYEWSVIKPILPNKPRGVQRVNDRVAVQMIATAVVRVHQHGACIADNNHQDMGRSRGARRARFTRWWTPMACRSISPSRLVKRTTIGCVQFSSAPCFRKRCYSRIVDTTRTGSGKLVRQQGAWANIPPKRNRKDRIFFSPHLYRARNIHPNLAPCQ